MYKRNGQITKLIATLGEKKRQKGKVVKEKNIQINPLKISPQ
jgi:hypothetical protein